MDIFKNTQWDILIRFDKKLFFFFLIFLIIFCKPQLKKNKLIPIKLASDLLDIYNKPIPSSSKNIIEYRFEKSINPNLSSDVIGIVLENTIEVSFPSKINLIGLIPTYKITGKTIFSSNGIQINSVTSNDFSKEVIYQIYAEDGSVKEYKVIVKILPDNSKEILAFSFLKSINTNLNSDITGLINGNSISLTVPFGTNITGLKANFTTTGVSVKIGTEVQTSGSTSNNFSTNLTYTVIAGDNSTKDYIVTIITLPSTAKDITAFSFLKSINTNLNSDITGLINGNSISLTVPFGTNITGLKANFTTTGVSVKIGTEVQTSGSTSNNFSTNLTYTVIAGDNSTKDYIVTITTLPSTAKDITAFSFLKSINTNLNSDIMGLINGNSISLTVPFGTNITGLKASFTTTGVSVKIGTEVQTSGFTSNNFSMNLTYTVIAGDNSTKDYTVTITTLPSTAKDITAFSFLKSINTNLNSDITGLINGNSISLTVPFGTNITGLKASFTTTGVSVKIGSEVQTSGFTSNNFSMNLTYTITAGDNSTQDYTVTVTILPSDKKEITFFYFDKSNNASLQTNIYSKIQNNIISVSVPFNTNVTALKASYTTTGQSVTVNGVTQVSGSTINNFSSSLTYTVTAENNSTVNYQINLTIQSSPLKEITSFSFLNSLNPSLTQNYFGKIINNSIFIELPDGTNTTSLIASFITTGQIVKIGTVVQTSEITSNNFSTNLSYTVYAADNSIKVYTIIIKYISTSSKEIYSFYFEPANNPSISYTIYGIISNDSIKINFPIGTNLSSLKANFYITGQSIKINSTIQQSGITANDHTNSLVYTIVAQDNSTKNYTVVTNNISIDNGWTESLGNSNRSAYHIRSASSNANNPLQWSTYFKENYNGWTDYDYPIYTGNVAGDNQLELVFQEEYTINTYNANGNLIGSFSPTGIQSISGDDVVRRTPWLSMLYDINGDGIKEIGVGARISSTQINFTFYSYTGAVIKTYSKQISGDSYGIPVSISNNKVVCEIYTNNTDNQTGIVVFDQSSGNQLYYYPTANLVGRTTVFSEGANSYILPFLTFSYSGAVCSNCGSDDPNFGYTYVLNLSNGSVRTKIDHGINYNINFESPGQRFYNFIINTVSGKKLIAAKNEFSYYNTGRYSYLWNLDMDLGIVPRANAVLLTYQGDRNSYFALGFADIDGDGNDEIIYSSLLGSNKQYILNNSLGTPIKTSNQAGILQFIHDFMGIGAPQIILSDNNYTKIMDTSLKVVQTINIGYPHTIFPSDLNQDGLTEFIIIGNNTIWISPFK